MMQADRARALNGLSSRCNMKVMQYMLSMMALRTAEMGRPMRKVNAHSATIARVSAMVLWRKMRVSKLKIMPR